MNLFLFFALALSAFFGIRKVLRSQEPREVRASYAVWAVAIVGLSVLSSPSTDSQFSVNLALVLLVLWATGGFLLSYLHRSAKEDLFYWLIVGNNTIAALLLVSSNFDFGYSIFLNLYLSGSILGAAIWFLRSITLAYAGSYDEISRFAVRRAGKLLALSVFAAFALACAIPSASFASTLGIAGELSAFFALNLTSDLIAKAPFHYLIFVSKKLISQGGASPDFPFVLNLIQGVRNTLASELGESEVLAKNDVGNLELRLLSASTRESFQLDESCGIPAGWREGFERSVDHLEAENLRLHACSQLRIDRSNPLERNCVASEGELSQILNKSLGEYGREFIVRSAALRNEYRQASNTLSRNNAVLLLGEPGVGLKTVAASLLFQHFADQALILSASEQTRSEELLRVFADTERWDFPHSGLIIRRVDLLSSPALTTLTTFLRKRKSRVPLVLAARESFFRTSAALDQQTYLELLDLAVRFSPLRDRPEDLQFQLRLLVGPEKYSALLETNLLPLFEAYQWEKNSQELAEMLEEVADDEELRNRLSTAVEKSEVQQEDERSALLYCLRLFAFDPAAAAAFLGVSLCSVEKAMHKYGFSLPTSALSHAEGTFL